MGTNNLLEASLPVISKTRCLASFSGIDGAVICAGGEANKNVCNGDSGGPLFVRDDAGSWVVVGVTSRGPPDCGVPGTPAIWTRVSAYSNFISSVVAQSDADAAAGRIWTDPTFRTYRAPLPVINGIRQVMGTPVRTERVRVSKLPFVKRNRGPKRNAAKAQHA